MNKKIAELIGVYFGIPTNNQVTTYYLNKFRQKFTTPYEVVKFDEVFNELQLLSIVGRDVEAPNVKEGGFTRKTMTPDVIKGAITLTGSELMQLQPGQAPVYVNGEKVDNSTKIRDRKLLQLKLSFIRTQEAMSSEIYLTGKLTLPLTQSVFTFDETDNVKKTFTASQDDLSVFLLGLVDEFYKENKIAPTKIEIGIDIFKELMKNEAFKSQAKAFNIASVTNNQGGNGNIYPSFNVLGYEFQVLPNAENVSGEMIDTSKLIILSNDNEFTQVYCGLSVLENEQLKVIETDVYIDEIVKKDPATMKYLLQSAFIPFIPVSKRIKRYAITIK